MPQVVWTEAALENRWKSILTLPTEDSRRILESSPQQYKTAEYSSSYRYPFLVDEEYFYSGLCQTAHSLNQLNPLQIQLSVDPKNMNCRPTELNYGQRLNLNYGSDRADN